MRVIICGGRDYQLTPEDYAKLDELHQQWHFTEVVSGCQSGADACAENWAELNGIPVKRFEANWGRYAKMAEAKRDFDMSAYANAYVVFPGGSETEDMHSKAVTQGLMVRDFRVG